MVGRTELVVLSFILMFICSTMSSAAYVMMGGDDDKATGPSSPGPAPVTFVVPTAADKLNECYGARHWDLRAAFGTDNTALGNHWTVAGTNEGRDHTCTLSDEEAQCYLDRYPDAKTYAGTDLKKARKHYYETGMAQNRDFACGLSVKEIQCYVERYPDLQTAFGTDYAARGTDKTLYKAGVHWGSNGQSEGRDYSCP